MNNQPQEGKLHRVFAAVAKHFHLSPKEEYTAWQSALARPKKAYMIYAAIVRSLSA